MRILPFYKYSPCGNLTILIKNTPLAPALRAQVAGEIIASDHLGAEQAGFVDTNAPRLDMMGGEFCLNATRATAVMLLQEGLLCAGTGEDAGWQCGTVSVSGVLEPVRVRARACADSKTSASDDIAESLCSSDVSSSLESSPSLKAWDMTSSFEADVQLERAAAPAMEQLDEGCWLVRVPGIAHLVLEADLIPSPSDAQQGAEETLALLRGYGLLEQEAAGCIWLHREPRLAITPFVWVRDTNTVYAEAACGSGTLAADVVCRALSHEVDLLSLHYAQPGGEVISVEPRPLARGTGWSVRVGGSVRLLARGEVFVRCLPEMA